MGLGVGMGVLSGCKYKWIFHKLKGDNSCEIISVIIPHVLTEYDEFTVTGMVLTIGRVLGSAFLHALFLDVNIPEIHFQFIPDVQLKSDHTLFACIISLVYGIIQYTIPIKVGHFHPVEPGFDYPSLS